MDFGSTWDNTISWYLFFYENYRNYIFYYRFRFKPMTTEDSQCNTTLYSLYAGSPCPVRYFAVLIIQCHKKTLFRTSHRGLCRTSVKNSNHFHILPSPSIFQDLTRRQQPLERSRTYPEHGWPLLFLLFSPVGKPAFSKTSFKFYCGKMETPRRQIRWQSDTLLHRKSPNGEVYPSNT